MITIEDVIQGIRDIMRQHIASTDKVEKITAFVDSVDEALHETRKREADA